jgi:glucan biosynthesis protein
MILLEINKKGSVYMTVGTKMQETIASCESILGNLHSFSLETQDQNAKQLFQNLYHHQQQILDHLKARLQYIQSQEPQYNQS